MTAEKCTYSSVQFPSVYLNDPIIPHSYQSPLNFCSGEYGQYFLATCAALNKCCVASSDYLLPVLPSLSATNFHVEKSRNEAYFLQHENSLRAERGGRNTGNKQAQLATQHLMRHKFHLKKVMEPASSSPPSCQEETCSKDTVLCMMHDS